MSSGNRVTRLYPQRLGSLFVVSYDSQSYGVSIRTLVMFYTLIRVKSAY
jgi:hypothetical protein